MPEQRTDAPPGNTASQAAGGWREKLHQIAARAAEDKEVAFRSLAHLVDIDALREAHRRIRKDGAAGVDGQTAEEYERELEANLASLLARLKAKTYRPPPVRRAYIPKANGTPRAIGIPTFEDKIVQRAYATVIEAIYEQDFRSCSYGFRPGRSAHDALEALWRECMNQNVRWVLEADIRDFFGTLEHAHLREFLSRRITDGGVRRLVSHWLEAGVLEEGQHHHPTAGTPQGGVISPLLANIYLHYVLDEWFENEVRPRLRGRAFLIRYADDYAIGFEHEADARRVLEVLPKRFARFGLELHAEKTRLVRFERPRDGGDDDGPGSFDFLGFTHHWMKTRKGRWAVTRRTAKDRLSRALSRINDWCRANRHLSVEGQHRMLSSKLRGHYAYYGITGNIARLAAFARGVQERWRKWLHRRSQRGKMTWDRFKELLGRYPLPRPRVVHSAYRATGAP